MKKIRFADAAGWYGTSAILLSFALVTLQTVSARSYIYLILNLTGAVGLGFVSYKRKIPQVLALNLIWAAIAIISLINLAAG